MEDYMTADDLARFLGFSTDWVYAQSRAGRIPATKIANRWVYRQEAIKTWLRSLEIPVK